MKCHEAQKLFDLRKGAALPVEVEEHVRACASCQAVLEVFSRVRSLLALKHYETPDAGFESRSAEKIRLYLQQHPRPGLRDWIESLLAPEPLLRTAAAAAMILFVAFHIRSLQTPPLSAPLADHTPTWRAPEQAPVAIQPLPLQPEPLISFQPPEPLLLAYSNTGPSRIQYGPAASRPVHFEY